MAEDISRLTSSTVECYHVLIVSRLLMNGTYTLLQSRAGEKKLPPFAKPELPILGIGLYLRWRMIDVSSPLELEQRLERIGMKLWLE
jgi:hypothetical protein